MMGILRGITTLVLLFMFLGLITWAWSGRRKKEFDSMARMALDEDGDANLKAEDDAHD